MMWYITQNHWRSNLTSVLFQFTEESSNEQPTSPESTEKTTKAEEDHQHVAAAATTATATARKEEEEMETDQPKTGDSFTEGESKESEETIDEDGKRESDECVKVGEEDGAGHGQGKEKEEKVEANREKDDKKGAERRYVMRR